MAAEEFSRADSRLLNALDTTFNGNPEPIDVAMGRTFDLELAGNLLCAMPFPGKPGKNVGPVYRYGPVIGA